MDAAVIIGFSYDNNLYGRSTDRTFLPGILIDIYRSYKYVESVTSNKNITVITDLVMDPNITDLKESIVKSIVDLEIINTIRDLDVKGYLHSFSSKADLLIKVKSVCKNCRKIFIYYTGHALNGNILLPLSNLEVCYKYNRIVDSSISFSVLRDIICSNSKKNAEIFSILDCCNSNGFDLPYKIINGVFRLTMKSNKVYPTQKFICLSSTSSDEVSASSKNGSIFTNIFFDNFGVERSLINLLGIVLEECKMKFDQTVTVNSTYPDLKLIWKWLLTPKDIFVKFNIIENYFIIKN